MMGVGEVRELMDRLRVFRDEREWGRFHTPANLAAALAIESGELQALFLWEEPEEQRRVVEERRAAVADELADVLISALNFAAARGIDPVDAAMEKIDRNEQRYPVDLARGNAKKYNELRA
jgi:dCTP diphosphatase